MCEQAIGEFFEGGGVVYAKDLGDRNHWATRKPARDQKLVMIHIGIKIEGQSMQGDPFTDTDTNRTDFGGLFAREAVLGVVGGGDPYAGGGRIGMGDDVILGERRND